MRSIALVGLMACAELPPLPQIELHSDWDCDDGFDEAIEQCEADGCPGFMSMNSPIDSETVHFFSASVFSVVKYGEDDTVRSIELHSTTDYFRSTVTFGSVDLRPDETTGSFRVLSSKLADTEDNAVTFLWEASNSQIPQRTPATQGIANLEINDGWVRTLFLVSARDDHILQGCAYMPID